MAFFSLKSDFINLDLSKQSRLHKIIFKLLKSPSTLLITILLGNTIVNIAFAIVAVLFTLDIVKVLNANETIAIIIEIILVTLILLLFGEITPKVIARKYPMQVAEFTSIPLSIIYLILFPVSKFFELITIAFKNLTKLHVYDNGMTSQEFQHLINVINNQDNIDVATKNVLKKINELSELTVKDILIPRVNLKAIEVNTSLHQILKIFSGCQQFYIPVYEDNIDNIIGIINFKTLLSIDNKYLDLPIKNINNIVDRALIVPESKSVIELLIEFNNSKSEVAIVIDEHGGTTGMIAKKNILERFLGISTESTDLSGIIRINSNQYIVKGNVLIEKLENVLNMKLLHDEADISTVNGLILHIYGRVPENGTMIKYQNLRFVVEEVKKKIIQRIKIIIDNN